MENFDWSKTTVLITGGTGSFGRKFAEVVLREKRPRKLIIFSRDELKQYEMRQTFPEGDDSPLRYFIGDVRDADRLRRAFHGVDVVVHAAAMKQVPACEYNPFEAVQTNIIGAKNVIDVAIDTGVKRVLAVSTDKAVSPVNLYGATKLVAEKLFVQGNAYAGGKATRFACTRYGNVVGSRGSVVPLFLRQREAGRITLTDPQMTRFWITLDQGIRLVIQSLEIMKGGEIFVPKIPSMRLSDLASALAAECRQEIIGMRPGEKLHEVLISSDESRHGLEYDDMYVVYPGNVWANTAGLNGGAPLAAGFCYASDTNVNWLTGEQFCGLLETPS
jgi:UDP-N-acetylglucosamine 4,6-dehydratase/5-epimerase